MLTVTLVVALAALATSATAACQSTSTSRPSSADDGTPLPDGVTLTAWRDLLPGVRLRRGHAANAFGLERSSRPQDLTAVEVDLTTPGLRLVTSPSGGPDAPPRPGHQVHTTGASVTGALAARPDVVLAVNANFFWPCCASAGSGPVGMTIFGLAIEDGRVVADPAAPQQPPGCPAVPAVPDAQSVGAPALLVDRSHRASMRVVTATDPLPADVEAAVAGGPQPDGRTAPPCGAYDGYPPGRPVPGPAWLLRDGRTETVPSDHPPEIVAARTFAGVTADGRRLLLATIDGSDTSGAAFFDEASWLRLLGAVDGLNLDGGGSTTMALRTDGLVDPPSSPCPHDGPIELLDVPDNAGTCRQRLVGNYLGVIAPRR